MCLLDCIHWTNLSTFLSRTSAESKYSFFSSSERAVWAMTVRSFCTKIGATFSNAPVYELILLASSHFIYIRLFLVTITMMSYLASNWIVHNYWKWTGGQIIVNKNYDTNCISLWINDVPFFDKWIKGQCQQAILSYTYNIIIVRLYIVYCDVVTHLFLVIWRCVWWWEVRCSGRWSVFLCGRHKVDPDTEYWL